MAKQEQNQFQEKFCLLNSQDHNVEINWSSSESNSYDEPSEKSSNFNKTQSYKRKRKKKVNTNIGNLDIAITDTSGDKKSLFCIKKSPILASKKKQNVSPILNHSFHNAAKSPILISSNLTQKSPILISKTGSPSSNCKVKKKLFSVDIINPNLTYFIGKHKHLKKEKCYVHSDVNLEEIKENAFVRQVDCTLSIKSDFKVVQSQNSTLKPKYDLCNRNTFFKGIFSSETSPQSSQNSISEVLTPVNSSKTSSDDLEIITCQTQAYNDSSYQLKEVHSNSSEESIIKTRKKSHFKKGGLACRLHDLVKKQNANLSLWQHERYLAANSNFLIPKGESTSFRIQNVCFKYGCYALDAVNINNEAYLIIINSCYVTETILIDAILKVYEPYKMLLCNDNSNLIINVYKFECINNLLK